MEQCLTSRCKTHEKNLGGVGGGGWAQNWAQIEGFCHFLKCASLVCLDIAQDCSLLQCLTSSRAEISKKFCDPIYGLTSPNHRENDLFLF